MMLIFLPSFDENSLDCFKALEDFILKISKGHNSAHPLIEVYICTKFPENTLNGIRVTQQHE